MQQTYDFAVLGSVQPEGLLLAAGLARNGYSVLVIPSSTWGEGTAPDDWPVYFPEALGGQRLEDLLFRAGFFRLEESGLVRAKTSPQVILKHHRFSLGKSWHKEIEREFPGLEEPLSRCWGSAREGGQRRLASEMRPLYNRYPELKDWVTSYSFMDERVKSKSRYPHEDLVGLWAAALPRGGEKFYRVNPKLGQPFSLFLLEHARKWGVKVLEEECQIRPSWNGFILNDNGKIKNLVINGSGSGRFLHEAQIKSIPDRIFHWLFFDELELPLDSIPEPLEEYAYLNLSKSVEGLPASRQLFIVRDMFKAKAVLKLGSWLPFEESRLWGAQVEAGREALKTLLPFMPESAFRPMPTTFELTEQKGDCVRRGEAGRLIFDLSKKVRRRRLGGLLRPRAKTREYTHRLGRRIFAVTPHYLPGAERGCGLRESLNLLVHFSKKPRAGSQAFSE